MHCFNMQDDFSLQIYKPFGVFHLHVDYIRKLILFQAVNLIHVVQLHKMHDTQYF